MCLIFSTNFSKSLFIRKIIQGSVVINVHRSSLLFLPYFNETWFFSTYFREIVKYQISWKSVHWVSSCSMRTDKRADRHVNLSKSSQNCPQSLPNSRGYILVRRKCKFHNVLGVHFEVCGWKREEIWIGTRLYLLVFSEGEYTGLRNTCCQYRTLLVLLDKCVVQHNWSGFLFVLLYVIHSVAGLVISSNRINVYSGVFLFQIK